MHTIENLSFLNDTAAHRVRVKPVVSKTSPRRRAVSSSSITVSVVASLLGDSAAPSCIHQEVSLRFRCLTPRACYTIMYRIASSCSVSYAAAVASFRVDHCCTIAPAVRLHMPPSSPVVAVNAAQPSSVSYAVAVASYRVDHCCPV